MRNEIEKKKQNKKKNRNIVFAGFRCNYHLLIWGHAEKPGALILLKMLCSWKTHQGIVTWKMPEDLFTDDQKKA